MIHKNISSLAVVFAFLFILSTGSVAYAHCGMCGPGAEHGDKASAKHGHAGKAAQMMDDKVATLEEAAAALKDLHPELSKKLQGYADHKKAWKE